MKVKNDQLKFLLLSHGFIFNNNINNNNMNKQLEQQQNFQGEVTSGFIMRLEKQTQENIRLARQPINNKGENHEKENDKKDYKKIIKIS